ncbi:hypothetical protein U7230_13850 [Carboxydochorda subterranea]|uniref:Calcineurin-like phosphoesterase domain-containing protein n=1 Tax=Carboxydichorda subterranea TaxID=3109565 RepID=A0ABZ1BWW1_9FIRM|nr:hypothetical protein [Limnochorda sp. L945t]WRP17151.1 hypothetical protein U7230_13850 [Limnochorda sp. L945t]
MPHIWAIALEWFNPWAREAVEWTLGRLSTDMRLRLGARRHTHLMQVGSLRVLLVHGTPRHPVTEYISGDVAAQILREQDPGWDVCLVGHTHLMGIYTRAGYRPFFESAEVPLQTPAASGSRETGTPRRDTCCWMETPGGSS